MASHSYHPDSFTNGLDADCPRCQEHAADPIAGLDRPHLTRLLKGILLSDLDRVAADRLREQLRERRHRGEGTPITLMGLEHVVEEAIA